MSDTAPSASTVRKDRPDGPGSGAPATSAPTSSPGVSGPPRPDWTVTVADRIESVVETVRDKTTIPITRVARGIVFGLLAAVAATAALILAVILIVRLHVYLPFQPEGRRLYTSYAVVGAIFVLAGAFFWRKRIARKD